MIKSEYQKLAMRTCNISEDQPLNRLYHAVFEMAAEAEEVVEVLLQHPNLEHLKRELGDCAWGVAEACTALDVDMAVSILLPCEIASWLSSIDTDTVDCATGMLIHAASMCGIAQKTFQGHAVDRDMMTQELQRYFLNLVDICELKGFEIDDVLTTNIEKLKARYPEGFSTERSLHREEGDT